jgi:THAP4-like, heme-binding beta-barrel domain
MKKFLHVTVWLLVPFLAGALLVTEARGDDAWKPLQFLIGDWVGSGSGKPGEGAGEFSLKLDLDGKILVRRNHNQLAPKPGEKSGATHDDLMIIYPQPGKDLFRADYFDNEGHVIHYTVSCADRKAVFQSDAAANAPRFRLTYELKAKGWLMIEFAIAAPGKEFQTYVSGTMKKR